MQEVVERRYTRILQEKSILPDLIMVDGEKGNSPLHSKRYKK